MSCGYREATSPVTVEHFYRKEFKKDPATEKLRRHWLKKFQETGSMLDQEEAGRPRVSAGE